MRAVVPAEAVRRSGRPMLSARTWHAVVLELVSGGRPSWASSHQVPPLSDLIDGVAGAIVDDAGGRIWVDCMDHSSEWACYFGKHAAGAASGWPCRRLDFRMAAAMARTFDSDSSLDRTFVDAT